MTESVSDSTQSPGPALVTGAGDRIGAAIARRLAAAGHPVIVHYRASADAAESVVSDIRASGGRAATAKADLANRKERAALVQDAVRHFGPLTVLVNNASLFEPDSARDLDEAIWDRHFAVHAEAPLFLARDFAAQLPDDLRGNIINIVDERVLQPAPAYLSYTLSKAVLHYATTTLAQSLAPRIRVNAIGPGPTLPPPGQTEEQFAAATSRLPLGLGASPDDVAEAILFILASPAFTGQMLALDGGAHIRWPERRGPTPRK